ncbi:MAG: AMP-binding protein, partial [Acidimicrobiales bacterium]
MPLSEWIRAVLAIDPAAPAVYAAAGDRRWGDLSACVSALDDALTRHGFGPGTEVAVVLRNRPEHFAAAIGLLATGRCLVTVSPLLGDEALREDVAGLAPVPVVAAPDDWERGLDESLAAGTFGLELTKDPRGPVAVRGGVHARAAEPSRSPGVAVRMLT